MLNEIIDLGVTSNEEPPRSADYLIIGSGSGGSAAAGQNESHLQTFHTVRTEGRIGFFGVPSTDKWTIPFAEVFRRKPSIEMRWDAQGEPGLTFFRAALDLIETRRIDVKKYRMQFYTLEQVPEVLELAANPTNGLIKAGVTFA